MVTFPGYFAAALIAAAGLSLSSAWAAEGSDKLAAAQDGGQSQSVKKPASSQKSAKAAKPKKSTLEMPRSSQETVTERSARLKRECKGRVNAGACTGYTD
jgi:hypothetical protein